MIVLVLVAMSQVPAHACALLLAKASGRLVLPGADNPYLD
jgi:hypothetical protein